MSFTVVSTEVERSKIFNRRIKLFIGVVFIIIAAFCVFARFLPFINHTIPLGYDPGIYRGIHEVFWQMGPHRDIMKLPHWIKHEPLWAMLTIALRFFGVSIDRILTRGRATVCSLLAVPVRFLAKRFCDKQTARIASALMLLSTVQYQAFTLLYFKQICAIMLVCFLFVRIAQGKTRQLIISVAALTLLHGSTTVVFGSIVGLRIIISIIQKRTFPRKLIVSLIVGLVIGILIYGPYIRVLINDYIHPLISTDFGRSYSGIFLSLTEFRRFEGFVFVFSLIGVWQKIRDKQFDLLVCGRIVTVGRVVFQWISYARVMILADLFICILAAYFVATVAIRHKLRAIIGNFLLVSVQGIFLLGYWSDHHEPLISPQLFADIQQIPLHTQTGSIIMVTDSDLTPRVLGYSQRSRISPGLSDLNVWKYETRLQWRNADGAAKCLLLQDYRMLTGQLYILLADYQSENLVSGGCFEQIRTGQESSLLKIYK